MRDKLQPTPGGPGGTVPAEPDFEREDCAGILAEVAYIARRAMTRRKTLVDRRGEHDVPDSDERTALAACEVKLKVLGFLGDGKNMQLETLKRELDRLGFELKPKGKLKAVKP